MIVMVKNNSLQKIVGSIASRPQWFALGFLLMFAVQYFFLTPSLWPVRAPNNPVTATDWLFAFLFATFAGTFLAVWRQRQDAPKVCAAAGGVGGLIGMWGATCPFCTFFILAWLGVPAAAGIGSAAFIEPYLDIVRLAALAIMAYGIVLAAK
ncbi:MAG: hypothetical protein HY519_01385 [Candidatus Aenigmarchaeota archaeon]|nr:hypothetical protein [Candidatus Aenigmarchaeota archaeon]